MRTAVVIGATGLVGSEIVRELLAADDVERVVVVARRAPSVEHSKLEVRTVDFRSADELAAAVRGDVLFSALGTTLRKAGSKEAQREIEQSFQVGAARAAKASGATCCVVVSSVGADPKALSFYTRLKGEIERDVAGLGFERVRFLRPSILLGDREESRPLEAIGGALARALDYVPGLRAFRPIPARTVARAALASARDPRAGARVVGPAELFELGA